MIPQLRSANLGVAVVYQARDGSIWTKIKNTGLWIQTAALLTWSRAGQERRLVLHANISLFEYGAR